MKRCNTTGVFWEEVPGISQGERVKVIKGAGDLWIARMIHLEEQRA